MKKIQMVDLQSQYQKIKNEVDADVYDEQISMMEMVLDVDDIASEMSSIREQFCKYM